MWAVASVSFAQSPTPVATPMLPPPAPKATPTKVDDADIVAAIQVLQELKAHNEQLLKQQEATLEFLDQLQKDAEQLKIFSKRG